MTVPFGSAPRRSAVVLLLTCALALSAARPAFGHGTDPARASGAPTQDWSQWRGGERQGVATATGLPVDLGPSSPDLQWKVEVKGDGISSPVVHGERVFLTTAYPGTEHAQVIALQTVGLPLLALIVLALTLLWTGARGSALVVLDGWLTRLVTLAFLAASMLALFRPATFPAWADGVFGWAWFYTGGIALVGLTAAIGWTHPRSFLRPAGALALAAAAVYLYRNIGLNSYGLPFKVEYRAVMVAPAVFGALWHTLVFLRTRRATLEPRGTSGAAASALVAALAVLLFVTINLWAPRAGLMRAVQCYDLASGKLLWDTPLFVAPQEQKYDINSFATPTPCTDGQYVFAYFGSGWACLDMDGKVLWQGRDEEYAPNTRYGCGASPVIYEDTFVVLQEKEYVRPSYIVAFDKATGRERFRVNPKYASDSYCTPLVLTRDGAPEIVTASAERAVAHDPRNGELLWDIKLPVRQMVPSLCYTGELLLVAGGTHTETSSSAVRLTGTGKQTKPEVVWQTKRFSPEVASPVVVDGRMFAVNDTGMLACLDVATGEILEKMRLEQGRYWSSLVASDGKIYAISDEGVVTVVAATPEMQELGKSALGEFCAATPAIAGNRMLIRTENTLWCFGSAAGSGKE